LQTDTSGAGAIGDLDAYEATADRALQTVAVLQAVDLTMQGGTAVDQQFRDLMYQTSRAA